MPDKSRPNVNEEKIRKKVRHMRTIAVAERI